MSALPPAGYLAVPSAGKGRPVLVLHAWWGLNDTIRAFCNRLAEAGFLAFAPDFYRGKVTDQIAEAEVLVDESNQQGTAGEDITAAVDYLRGHEAADGAGLAVIGFSLGAYYAFDLSQNAGDIVEKVVIFYGSGAKDFSRAKAAYLGHFAENDVYEDAEYVASIEDAIKAAGLPVTFHHYAGTGHWFFEPDRADVYNPEASQLAWERTIAFLKGTSA